MNKTLITSLLALGLASAASAQTIVDASSYSRINSSGAKSRSFNEDAHVGSINNVTLTSAGFAFELPDLGGNTVSTSQLTTFFDKYGSDGAAFDLSLFVKTASSSTLSSADFIAPANDFTGSTPSGWTEIELKFLPANSSLSTGDSITMSSSGQTALTSFLNTYYTATPAGGDFLIAGLAAQTNGTPIDDNFEGVVIRGDNDATTPVITNLSITAIPEPSSFALLAGALGLGLVLLRRRRA